MTRNEISQLQADVHVLWKRGADTADIARALNVRECEVERALHRVMDARFAVNTVLGAG